MEQLQHPPTMETSVATNPVELTGALLSGNNNTTDIEEGRHSTFRPSKNEVFYSWENVNFSVPTTKSDHVMLEATRAYQAMSPQELKNLQPQDLRLEILKKSQQGRVFLD